MVASSKTLLEALAWCLQPEHNRMNLLLVLNGVEHRRHFRS
jgi:hypothetical protein